MKLSDLRKLSVKKNIRISFRLHNGMACVLDEHGIAQLPGLNTMPDFNLEQELAQVQEFVLEPVLVAKQKSKIKPESLNRDQIAGLMTPVTADPVD